MKMKTLAMAAVVLLVGVDSFAQPGRVRDRERTEADRARVEREVEKTKDRAVEARAAGARAEGQNTLSVRKLGLPASVLATVIAAFPFQAAYTRTDMSPSAIETITQVEKRWTNESVVRDAVNVEFAQKCARPVEKDSDALTPEAMTNLATLINNARGNTVEEFADSIVQGMDTMFTVSAEDKKALAVQAGLTDQEAQRVESCKRIAGISRPMKDDNGCPILRLKGLPPSCASVAKYVVLGG